MWPARLLSRLQARRRLGQRVAFYYHPQYVTGRGLGDAGLAHFAERPAQVVAELVRRGLLAVDDLRTPGLVSFAELGRFHTSDYLEAVLTPETLGAVFGLPGEAIDVDALLNAQRRAVAGTVAAARWARGAAGRIGMNLGGGFHHARRERGAGFCIFNDIGVAIETLRGEGEDRPLAIVDLDFHQGDGNLTGFASDASVLTFSLHGSVFTSEVGAADFGAALPAGTNDAVYLEALGRALPEALHRHRPGLVFYVAGVDGLHGDGLGNWRLSRAGIQERDRQVLALCDELDASLVVTLAGGYGDDAWRASVDLATMVLVGRPARLRRIADPRRAYAAIARRLDPLELQRDSDELSEADVWMDLGRRHQARRLLDYYSQTGVEYALERYGLLERLRRLGFAELRVVAVPDDAAHQILRVFGRVGQGGVEVLLVELVARRRQLHIGSETFEMLGIEWLLLQNPAATFSRGRSALPGQEHPGLGLATEIEALLVQVCRRLSLDGLLESPAHYHMAAFALDWRFVDPAVEGRLQALRQALAGLEIGEASWAVHQGRVRTRAGDLVAWTPQERVLPVTERLAAALCSADYERQVQEARARWQDAHLEVVGAAPVAGLPADGTAPA